MNDLLAPAPAEPKPEFWYGLPHGYAQLDLHPTPEGLAEMAGRLRALPEEFRDRADQVFRLYAVVLTMLRQHQVQSCALGMHPDESGGSVLSVLTVATVAMPGNNPKRVLATLLADGAGSGTENGIRPVELPAGTGFLFESERTTQAPGTPPEGQDGPREGTIWQGTVAIPDTATSSVITLQMVTAAVHLVDDYRAVLLGTASTLTFTDPSAPAAGNGAGLDAGPAAASMRDVFG